MNIFLNPEQEQFIKKQIETGKYTNALEVIKTGKYTNALEVINAAFKVLEEKELQPDKSHHKKNREQIGLDESDDKVIQDFMKISESALNEYWLNEEEDEAWKNL